MGKNMPHIYKCLLRKGCNHSRLQELKKKYNQLHFFNETCKQKETKDNPIQTMSNIFKRDRKYFIRNLRYCLVVHKVKRLSFLHICI